MRLPHPPMLDPRIIPHAATPADVRLALGADATGADRWTLSAATLRAMVAELEQQGRATAQALAAVDAEQARRARVEAAARAVVEMGTNAALLRLCDVLEGR